MKTFLAILKLFIYMSELLVTNRGKLERMYRLLNSAFLEECKIQQRPQRKGLMYQKVSSQKQMQEEQSEALRRRRHKPAASPHNARTSLHCTEAMPTSEILFIVQLISPFYILHLSLDEKRMSVPPALP